MYGQLAFFRNWTEVEEFRKSSNLLEYSNKLITAGNLHGLLLDIGFKPISKTNSFSLLPDKDYCIPHKRILRLETVAEEVIKSACELFKDINLSTVDNLIEYVKTNYLKNIDPPPPDVVGFKTVCCYRTGLAVSITDDLGLTKSFLEISAELQRTPAIYKSWRLFKKPVIDWIVRLGLSISVKYSLPIQFHTGFGDK
ncbi:hypothetical protein HK096_001934, partial [Nowakowskiella sp. JEL0078]